MKYRSRDAIVRSILAEIKKGDGRAQITEIMYKVFLSHYQLKKYLADLTKAGLVVRNEKEGYSKSYTITLKGEKLLRLYHDMNELVPDVEN